MNPGIQALEQLVEMGLFGKGQAATGAPIQYWPRATRRPTIREWRNAAGLVHVASSWVGRDGLSVTTGRIGSEVIYHYRETDREVVPHSERR